MLIFLLAAILAAGQSSAVLDAREQLENVRQQVAAGLLPAAAIAQAEESVADANDRAILDRTLYGQLGIEDLTEAQGSEMISAAERRVARILPKLESLQKLCQAGLADRARLADLQADLDARTAALQQARSRAELLDRLVAIARAEVQPVPLEQAVEWRAKEHVDGDHPLEAADIREITLAFEKQFREPLPVSARGETAVHRAMGFDHTGRIDVALAPDSRQGQWLRKYLETRSIPYYAFRAAIPGKATAPHIHIGPASTRLHLAD